MSTYNICSSSENVLLAHAAQKWKFSIKGFFSKCDEIRNFLRIWSHLLKISLMENFIFCAVLWPVKEDTSCQVAGNNCFEFRGPQMFFKHCELSNKQKMYICFFRQICRGFTLKLTKRAQVPLKCGTRDFSNSSPFQRTRYFNMTITRVVNFFITFFFWKRKPFLKNWITIFLLKGFDIFK